MYTNLQERKGHCYLRPGIPTDLRNIIPEPHIYT